MHVCFYLSFYFLSLSSEKKIVNSSFFGNSQQRFGWIPSKVMSTPYAEVVEGDTLFVSEPNPAWFGNPKNLKQHAHWTNSNWLKSRFHFSFAEYHDQNRSRFGVLRVMNDDLVQPDRGFGTHPHANMEICTYVVSGELTHQDSMGTEETLQRGAIQFMTAVC